MLTEHSSSEDYIMHRATYFCCSAVYAKREMDCRICIADHAMMEGFMACTSPSCVMKEEAHVCCVVEDLEVHAKGLSSHDQNHFRRREGMQWSQLITNYS